MDLLRNVGALAPLDRRDKSNRLGVACRSDYPFAESSQRLCLALWQRQSSSARNRDDVSRYSARLALAESFGLLRFGDADENYWEIRGEDDRALRIRSPGLLAIGHPRRRSFRLQHGNQPRPGDSHERKPGEVQ